MNQRSNVSPPSFLGIGPPKTATSWLYNALSHHPGVGMPPNKEIGYLWAKRFLPRSRYGDRFFSGHWYYATRRRYMRNALRKHLLSLRNRRFNRRNFVWDLRFGLLPHTDTWYEHLFDQRKVSGDITPKYSELAAPDIRAIRDRFGATKIVITARDPVEREWSRAKMNLCRNRGVRQPHEVLEREWITHFDEPEQAEVNDYVALYERWAQVFGEEQVLLLYYDEISRAGWTAFLRVCNFLDLPPLPTSYQARILVRVNAGIRVEIPPRYDQYLFEKHRSKIVRLTERFPQHPYPHEWLSRHEHPLGATTVLTQAERAIPTGER